ncbi:23S rRNA pseudouridine(2604) synthase RluF [Aequorivita antarctica]|uniref:Pseudouridine synthase n=1 Tax=Aequorivita antarctica TaxID=153266 RepID=A0A5C6YWQ0_9FLAO|nr:23S rRNA pseudouridine(2604) synthase RluF [Aequorivita antarctica]TXD72088.1 23S rRNA pseudouridine(2604) synthase RluF [Aequorivita antarctica]SRX75638.1 23S rRNA pseudouridine(2604) synthase [Aequorivita antarctica]
MNHPDSVRLNKAISDSGYCSRREADTLIEKGRVTVNGEKSGLGDRVMPGDVVMVDGKLITENTTEVFIMLNKPVGITCTTDTRFDDNVVDFVNHPERIFPVGRLDKPSEGVLLLTNVGDIVNKILRAGNKHEKEYIVKVDRHVTDEFIKRMGSGIPILETVTKRCKVERFSRFEFRIILVQGLNRQIRRMCEYLGYEVVALQRIRIMNLELGDLPVGQWRDLTAEELKTLKDSVKDSDGQPKAYGKDERKENIEERGKNQESRVKSQDKRQKTENIKPEVKRREERKLQREQKNTEGRRRRGPN